MHLLKSSLVALLMVISMEASATFSIVAVDPTTGEVGSAGASCINNAIVISEVIPGRGAIHAQAALNQGNKQNARNRMLAGDSPQQIVNFVINNDVQGNPQSRQYGVVDFGPSGTGRSAGFTGSNAQSFRDHITGPTYAIAGNILIGARVLTQMESRFLSTGGSLANRLMAAMQGANFAGADRRCLNEGTSSRSAFLRVARPNDSSNNLTLDINVGSTPFGVEPINVLQDRFDGTGGTVTAPSNLNAVANGNDVSLSWADNSTGEDFFQIQRSLGSGNFAIIGQTGRGVANFADDNLAPGNYIYRVRASRDNVFSNFSNSDSVSIGGGGNPPNPPGNLAASANGDDVNLSWSDNSTGEDFFEIQRSTGGAFVVVNTVGRGSTRFTDNNLADGTYSYRIRASRNGEFSSFSNTASVTVGGGGNGPNPPSNLNVSVNNGNDVRVNWNDNSTGEDFFEIQRSSGGAFVAITTVGRGNTSVTDNNLAAGTYTYRVRASRGGVFSAFSNTDSVVIGRGR